VSREAAASRLLSWGCLSKTDPCKQVLHGWPGCWANLLPAPEVFDAVLSCRFRDVPYPEVFPHFLRGWLDDEVPGSPTEMLAAWQDLTDLISKHGETASPK